jgi:hypothetical protein
MMWTNDLNNVITVEDIFNFINGIWINNMILIILKEFWDMCLYMNMKRVWWNDRTKVYLI